MANPIHAEEFFEKKAKIIGIDFNPVPPLMIYRLISFFSFEKALMP
jgi:hypothetical protein